MKIWTPISSFILFYYKIYKVNLIRYVGSKIIKMESGPHNQHKDLNALRHQNFRNLPHMSNRYLEDVMSCWADHYPMRSFPTSRDN